MSESFYCKVVGEQITGDICESRIKQGKELRAKGDPHPSLNKCIICRGLTSAEPTKPLDVAEEFCSHCKRPKVFKKLRWNKKRGMHTGCYVAVKKGAALKVTKSVAAPVIEQPEDPERIIQCSAPVRTAAVCGPCRAVKNCAIYDKAVSEGLILESSLDRPLRLAPDVKVTTHPAGTITEQPLATVRVDDTVAAADKPLSAPDTTEQNHYTECAIQPIDFIIANNMDFLEGNVIKYVTRYKRKNGLEDLAKARHYLDMLIKREEESSK